MEQWQSARVERGRRELRTRLVASVVGHALVSVLVVLTLGYFVTLPIAFVSGVLFAVHPVHVEAVSNVVGGAEVIAAGFVLLALLLHLRGDSTWPRALAIAAAFALALGAKESAVTLPGVIFLADAARRRLDFADLGSYVRERWRTYAALSLVAAVMLAARVQILGSVASPQLALGSDLLLEIPRVWTLGEVWTHYVRLMVFPLDLASDYSPDVIRISTGPHALNAIGLLLALLILAGALLSWRQPKLGPESRSARVFGFGVVWFIVTISPVSNVVFVSGVLLAERTLYLPSVGAVAILAWLLVLLAQRRRAVGWGAAALVVTLLGARTWTRSPAWLDDVAWSGAMISDVPQSGRSLWLIGTIFMARGQHREGLRAYREAIPRIGANPDQLTSIALQLHNAGNLRGAEGLFRLAWIQRPGFHLVPARLGMIYSEMGDAERAEEALAAALELEPNDLVSLGLISQALAELGRWRDAAEARRRVIGLGEDVWQQWTSLAELEARAGDIEAARSALATARQRVSTEEEELQIDSIAAQLSRLGNGGGPGGGP